MSGFSTTATLPTVAAAFPDASLFVDGSAHMMGSTKEMSAPMTPPRSAYSTFPSSTSTSSVASDFSSPALSTTSEASVASAPWTGHSLMTPMTPAKHTMMEMRNGAANAAATELDFGVLGGHGEQAYACGEDAWRRGACGGAGSLLPALTLAAPTTYGSSSYDDMEEEDEYDGVYDYSADDFSDDGYSSHGDDVDDGYAVDINVRSPARAADLYSSPAAAASGRALPISPISIRVGASLRLVGLPSVAAEQGAAAQDKPAVSSRHGRHGSGVSIPTPLDTISEEDEEFVMEEALDEDYAQEQVGSSGWSPCAGPFNGFIYVQEEVGDGYWSEDGEEDGMECDEEEYGDEDCGGQEATYAGLDADMLSARSHQASQSSTSLGSSFSDDEEDEEDGGDESEGGMTGEEEDEDEAEEAVTPVTDVFGPLAALPPLEEGAVREGYELYQERVSTTKPLSESEQGMDGGQQQGKEEEVGSTSLGLVLGPVHSGSLERLEFGDRATRVTTDDGGRSAAANEVPMPPPLAKLSSVANSRGIPAMKRLDLVAAGGPFHANNNINHTTSSRRMVVDNMTTGEDDGDNDDGEEEGFEGWQASFILGEGFEDERDNAAFLFSL